jgi:hypothetical protein
MDWMKIGSAVLLVAMIVFIFPSAKAWMTNSPKGSAAEWMTVVVALLAVAGFVMLLVAMV